MTIYGNCLVLWSLSSLSSSCGTHLNYEMKAIYRFKTFNIKALLVQSCTKKVIIMFSLQVYPSFTSLPPELPTETCSGLISGIKSWVKGRKESRSSTSSSGPTSAPRQEPDGAPASSPRKASDDYRTSGASSPKNSPTQSDQAKPDIRAEIIAASKKRNGDAINKCDKQAGGKLIAQQKAGPSNSGEAVKQESQHPQPSTHEDLPQHHHKHHKHSSKHHLKEDHRRSQSPDRRRLGSGLMHELSELHQERREYREYRTPSRHSRHSQSPVGTQGSKNLFDLNLCEMFSRNKIACF